MTATCTTGLISDHANPSAEFLYRTFRSRSTRIQSSSRNRYNSFSSVSTDEPALQKEARLLQLRFREQGVASGRAGLLPERHGTRVATLPQPLRQLFPWDLSR